MPVLACSALDSVPSALAARASLTRCHWRGASCWLTATEHHLPQGTVRGLTPAPPVIQSSPLLRVCPWDSSSCPKRRQLPPALYLALPGWLWLGPCPRRRPRHIRKAPPASRPQAWTRVHAQCEGFRASRLKVELHFGSLFLHELSGMGETCSRRGGGGGSAPRRAGSRCRRPP